MRDLPGTLNKRIPHMWLSYFPTEEVAYANDNDLYNQAVDLVLRERKASISFVQRKLSISYSRATLLIERMEREHIVGPADHVCRREVWGRR